MEELRENLCAILGVEVKSERYSVNTATKVTRMNRGRLKGGSLTRLRESYKLMSNSVNVERTLANSVNDAAKIQPKSRENHTAQTLIHTPTAAGHSGHQ